MRTVSLSFGTLSSPQGTCPRQTLDRDPRVDIRWTARERAIVEGELARKASRVGRGVKEGPREEKKVGEANPEPKLVDPER